MKIHAFKATFFILVISLLIFTQWTLPRAQSLKTTIIVSIASDGTQGNGDSADTHISKNGQYVSFSSYANNLVEGDMNECRGFYGVIV